MKKINLFFLALFFLVSFQSLAVEKTSNDSFSFVFMTDIHLQPERNATKGFLQAIETVNNLKPDFVLTGGDLIMDALGQTYSRSDSLYDLYETTIQQFDMPVFNTMGNHEIFGLYEESGIDPTHKEYGKKMYENRLNKRYYSFEYNNWHFIILDGISDTGDKHYFGMVDSTQVEWLKDELKAIGKEEPVVVSTHIPLLSVGNQIMHGPTEAFKKSSIITNAREIINILENYNVKIVLQGHLHFLEDINYNGIHYITGGAVCAGWWKGPRFGMEEGFLLIKVKNDDFTWKYIDYGWEARE